eukprot:TRINITY_DN74169_c0_g1_i1.p1 TRINITY_DN74169_c0_g1~~TRINITY_DN74169_c0_g1_i1.p1  ORF type:complete len:116 (-),score=9.06 TRINITY_DN74169_c0_g1_i1:139-486(-)
MHLHVKPCPPASFAEKEDRKPFNPLKLPTMAEEAEDPSGRKWRRSNSEHLNSDVHQNYATNRWAHALRSAHRLQTNPALAPQIADLEKVSSTELVGIVHLETHALLNLPAMSPRF